MEKRAADYTVELDDGRAAVFQKNRSMRYWAAGLEAGGFVNEQKIEKVSLSSQASKLSRLFYVQESLDIFGISKVS